MSFSFVEKNNVKKTSFRHFSMVVFSALVDFLAELKDIFPFCRKDSIKKIKSLIREHTATRWTRYSYISRK